MILFQLNFAAVEDHKMNGAVMYSGLESPASLWIENFSSTWLMIFQKNSVVLGPSYSVCQKPWVLAYSYLYLTR
jgi:hypothetical protein